MSLTSIAVYTCDRCKTVLEVRADRDAHKHYDWGRITVVQNNGPIQIGKNHPSGAVAHRDICPVCIAAIDKWWTAQVGRGEHKAEVLRRGIGEASS